MTLLNRRVRQTNLRLAAFAAATALTILGSEARAQHDHAHSHAHEHNESAAGPATIKSEILRDDGHAAGKTLMTFIRLTDAGGKPVTLDDLTVAHTEKLHLLIVDESLTDYHHEHPVPAEKPGEYRFEFTPRFGGTYHVWADLLPVATGKQEYSKTTLQVSGSPAAARQDLNTVAEVGGYRFEMSMANNEPLQSGKATLVEVRVRKDGREFAELEPVMGAFAHVVAFPADLKSVAHVHPMGKEPTTAAERGGPQLSFHIQPEQPGYHKIWVQTQIGGRERYVAFGVQVKAAAPAGADVRVEYSCPMHPEVKQKGPGKCPKCGMALIVPPQTKAASQPGADER